MSYDPAARRKTPLAVTLVDDITRHGPLTVAAFMERCLWDARYGYYATRQPFGRTGDFITAPEISQTFGELIGLWTAVVWRDLMKAPVPFTLAELGPGRGTLMRDMLRATAKVPGFHRAACCHLVEASSPLNAMQRDMLASSAVKTVWSADLAAATAPAIIIANEFFDALPVAQWLKTELGWSQRCVDIDGNGGLCFSVRPGGLAPAHLDAIVANVPPNTVVEVQAIKPFIDSMGDLEKAGPVAALVIDYGHEKSACGDTLQAVRQHAYEHPLTSPGEADLSVQVDFSQLATAARQVGLVVDGPVSQAEFLGRLGIIERARKLMMANPGKANDLEMGVARLMAPEAMGSRFKVLGLRSAGLPVLPGFSNAGT